MEQDEPTWLNRSAIIITPKAPYIAWANSFDDGPRYEEADDEEGPPVFLGPGTDTVAEVDRFVERHFDLFFEHWLNDWCTDPSLWPQRRTRKMFHEWFDVRIASMVIDTVRAPLELE
jgi:hypothetical protein